MPAFQNFTADQMSLVTPPNSNGWNIPLRILTQKIVSKLSEIWSGLFFPDPDPDQFCGSMQFWNGSGCGSGSADPYLWPMDPDEADPGGQKTYVSYGSGCGSATLIWILIFYPSRFPDQGVKKVPDPGSATLRWSNLSGPVWRRGWQRRAEACVLGSIPTLCAGTRHGVPHPQLYSKKILITTCSGGQERWNQRFNVERCFIHILQ